MRKFAALLLVALLCGCTNSSKSALRSYGKKHKIEVLTCDGQVARRYISTGIAEGSEGFVCFEDSYSGEQVCLSGTLVVEVLP